MTPSLCEPTLLLNYHFVCGNASPDRPFLSSALFPCKAFQLQMGLKLCPQLCPVNKTVQKTFRNTDTFTLFTLGSVIILIITRQAGLSIELFFWGGGGEFQKFCQKNKKNPKNY